MPIKKRDVDRNLMKKGFVRDAKHDHVYYHYYDYNTKKKTRIHTKMSHNNKELDEDLISTMSKELYLSKGDFIRLVQCHIDWEQYDKMMIKDGIIKLT